MKMKVKIIFILAVTLLTSCATYPRTYDSEKQYHDEYVDKSCYWIRKQQIKDNKQIKTIRKSKEYKSDVRGIIILTIITAPFALAQPFFPGEVVGDAADKSETFHSIDNLKIELRMLTKIANEKYCPEKCDHEIITDKSHSMHFPH